MLNFDFYSPTYFAFGKGAEQNTGALIRQFGGTKVLFHYGGGSIKNNGVYNSIVASLTGNGIPFVELGGVLPNPRSGLVYQGIELCRNEKVDFILAVGGGSTIDSAKAIALGTLYDGDFWDYYGTGKKLHQALPVGTVLTIAAAGSEGSGNSVITHENGMLKRSAGSDVLRPKFSIMNPQFTCTLPPYQTACGATDIIAHICERYFTNTTGVDVTDRICEALLKTMIDQTPKAIQNPNDYDTRANIMWAGMVAHNNLCGVGRDQDWSSHAIEHELSALYDIAHGAGLAVIMPNWMQYVMEHDINRFVQFATRVWDIPDDPQHPKAVAAHGISAFRHFLTQIGMPATFGDIGAKMEDIPQLVKTSGISPRHRLGHFVELDDTDVAAIYKMAL